MPLFVNPGLCCSPNVCKRRFKNANEGFVVGKTTGFAKVTDGTTGNNWYSQHLYDHPNLNIDRSATLNDVEVSAAGGYRPTSLSACAASINTPEVCVF